MKEIIIEEEFIMNDDELVETTILDTRAGQRPSDVVEERFLALLPDLPIPVSCLTHRLVRRYG